MWKYFWILWSCTILLGCIVESVRDLQDVTATITSFDLLCQRLATMPNFLCECVSEIPYRAIECQSTEICSTTTRCETTSTVCGQFLFQVDYLAHDISQLESCVTYTQTSHNDEYKDGCFTLIYQGESTPTSCRLAFVTDAGQERLLKDCESCSLCDNDDDDDPSLGVAVQASCETVEPLASTSACTQIELDAFFPGFTRATDEDCPVAGASSGGTIAVPSCQWMSSCMGITAWLVGALL